MIKILMTIGYALILNSAIIYVWHKLVNKKINFKNYKLYVTLISITLTSLFNYFNINGFIRMTISTICLMIFYNFLFTDKLEKAIVTPIYSEVLMIALEILYTLVIVITFGSKAQTITATYLGQFITNISIALLLIGVSHIKLVRKAYNKLLKLTDKINPIQLSLFCIVAILIANILLMSSYYKVKFGYLFAFNVIMTLVCFVIIFYSFKTQNNYNKVSDKYNVAINSLKDYESMMHKYRIANHENKNLLLTVRAMILSKDKNIPEYIDSIVENKHNTDDDKLLFKMSVIPSGGLRATIYSEILKIKENKIDYSLNIDNQVKTIDLIELDTNTVIEICKIIGVFIDNAIEAVKGTRKRFIDISLFVESNTINIKVSNTYKGKIDLDLIYNEGYTTKGGSHGYGLSLVKSIVDSNKAFKNTTEINKTVFSQVLSIEYKKAH